MKSILHLKDDTEYQIPLREAEKGNRAEVGANKENKADVETAANQSQNNPTANKETNEVTDEEETAVTQSQGDSTVNNETEEISQEEVNNENDSALDNLEDETKKQEPSSTEENSSNDITTESVPPADTAKAALDEMKKLASQEGVIHPSLFISNFSKILGLMERAMQLQVKESGSVTKESDSATEVPEQAETPTEG